MRISLSKSLYTKGLQCQKALWLKKYNKAVLTPPNAATMARFKEGNIVGDLACDLFPGGREIPFKGTTFSQKIALTQEWLDEGLNGIYEDTFEYGLPLFGVSNKSRR